MGAEVIHQFIWGVKKEHLPEGLDPESIGLEWFQSGDPQSDNYDDFYGREICGDLTGLDVYTDSSVGFDEWNETRQEVDGILEKSGVKQKARMYILTSIGY